MDPAIRLAFLALATLALAGCPSVPSTHLDQARAGPIKTVALLRVAESQRFTVADRSGVPALGGVAAAVALTPNTQQFVERYNLQPVRLSTVTVDELRRLLGESGKDVTYLPNEVAKLKDGKDDYSHLSPGTDAILNVWFGSVGYVADGPVAAAYEPWIMVTARLLHGTSKQVLYQKTFTAGRRVMIENAVFVPCAQQYRFAVYDNLMRDFPTALDGLVECQKAVARRIADDLK